MTDRELIELAAKAEGREPPYDNNGVFSAWIGDMENGHWWDPLNDDGDALRLSVRLNFEIERSKLADRAYVGQVGEAPWVEYVNDDQDLYQATRRAIVQSAAEIGRKMK